MTKWRSCREFVCTGLFLSVLGAYSLSAVAAEPAPNTNAAARVRDDRSAAITFALQAFQQLQSQQRATLQVAEDIRQETATNARRIDTLRNALVALGACLMLATAAAAVYFRWLLQRLRGRGQLPIVLKSPLDVASRLHERSSQVATLLSRGQILLEQGHPVDALTCFEQASNVDTPTTNVLIKKGTALERLGRLAEALASYEQALALDASRADAYIGKGNVLNRLERYSEALACFEQAADCQHRIAVLPTATATS